MGREHFAEVKIHHRRRAIEIRERIDPAHIARREPKDLAESLLNLGSGHWRTVEFAQADQSFRRAEDILLSIGNDGRGPPWYVALAVGHVNVNWGGMLRQLGTFLRGRCGWTRG